MCPLFLILLFSGVWGFDADYDFLLLESESTPIEVLQESTSASNFDAGRQEFIVNNANLAQIHVFDLQSNRVFEKDKALFGELSPFLVSSSGFQIIVDESRGKTCSWFLVGSDSLGLSEVPLSEGSQNISVDSLTSIFLGVDVDEFELCQASFIVDNKQLDLIVDFKIPFDEQAYRDYLLNDRGVPCDDNSTNRCLRIGDETIDLDACVSQSVPLAVCIQGQSEIDRFLFEESNKRIRDLESENSSLKGSSQEAVARDVNEVKVALQDLREGQVRAEQDDNDNLASLIVGLVGSIVLVGGYVVWRNQNDFETQPSKLVDSVVDAFNDFTKQSGVNKDNEKSDVSASSEDAQVFLNEDEELGFVPYKNNLSFLDEEENKKKGGK